MKPPCELTAVKRCAVGQGGIGLVPDMLRRVKFRRIGREPFHTHPATALKEVPHGHPRVDCPAVPKEHDWPTKMLKKMSQKRDDIQAGEIMGTHSDIEGHSLPVRRGDQRTECRNPVLPIKVSDQWRLPSDSPCPLEVRDEQKSTFVEEDQIGSDLFCVFLYVAICNVSSAQWLPHPAVMRAVLVSGSSNQDWSTVSRCDSGDMSHQNTSESIVQHGLMSKGQWCIPGRQTPSAEAPEVSLSETDPVCSGDRMQVVGLALLSPSADIPATSVKLSRDLHLPHRPLPTDFCRILQVLWRGGAALPIVRGFHLVSCSIG